MRKVAAASVILLVSFGVAVAEEFGALITKVDGNKVTFHKVKKGEKGDAMTLPVADNVKVVKGKYNEDTKKTEAGDAIEGGLKAKAFAKIDAEKGMNARITADDGKITQIIVGGKKKKKAN